jgi:hypothetical protein
MSNHVDVWLGRVADQAAYEDFFAESYGDDDGPISPFAASQGVTFYDHDFIDRRRADAFSSLDEAFEGISFGSSFVEEVWAQIVEFDYNVVVACYSDDFSSPRSARLEGVQLTYVWSLHL